MQRKIKWHRVLLICGGLLLGLGLVYLVALLVTLRQIEIAWRPITYSKTVSFPEKGVNIHIDTRVGGLLGNHSYITFSGTMKDQVLEIPLSFLIRMRFIKSKELIPCLCALVEMRHMRFCTESDRLL